MNQGIFKVDPSQEPQANAAPAAPVDRVERPATPKQDFNLGNVKAEPDMGMVSKINAGMGSKDASADLAAQEAYPFSDDDVELAEQLMFQGWARKSYPVMSGKHTVEVLTSTPLELDLVDGIVQDWLSAFKEGEPFPASSVIGSRSKLLNISLSFQGVDKTDFCQQPELRLSTIKNGINELNRSIMSGEIVKIKENKRAVTDLISKRASFLAARYSTDMVDLIVGKKIDLENSMRAIMGHDKTIPKS